MVVISRGERHLTKNVLTGHLPDDQSYLSKMSSQQVCGLEHYDPAGFSPSEL